MDLSTYNFGTLTNYGTGWYSPEFSQVKGLGTAEVKAILSGMSRTEFDSAVKNSILSDAHAHSWALSGTGTPGIYWKNPDTAWNTFKGSDWGADSVARDLWSWSPQGNWWQQTAGLGPAPDASEPFLENVFVPLVKMAIGAAVAVTAGAALSGELFAAPSAAAAEAGGMSVITETVGPSTFSTEILNLPYGGATIDPAFTGQVFYTGGALPVSIVGASGMSIAPAVFEASTFSVVEAARQAKQIVSEVRNAQNIGNIISPPQSVPITPRSITMEIVKTPAPAFIDRAQENLQQAAPPSNTGSIPPASVIAGQPENFKNVAMLGAALIAAFLVFGGKS